MKFIERPDLLRVISRNLMESSATLSEAHSGAASFRVFAQAIAVCLFVQTSASFAADLTWDRQSAPGIQGGSDDWNTNNTKWQDGGGNNIQWVNDGTSRAIFETGNGTVTIEENIAVDGMLFKSNGYTIDRTSGSVLQIAGPTSFTVQNIGNTATIDAPIEGSGDVIVDGAGRLVLRGLNTYTGVTTVAVNSILLNRGTIGGGATAGGVTNAGRLTNAASGIITGLITNTGQFDGAGTVNGDVNNSGSGTITTIGNLIINGKLDNTSSNLAGVSVLANQSIKATNISNAANAFIVNAGTLSSTNVISNAGSIDNSGVIDGGINNSKTVNNTNRINGGITNSGTLTTTGRVDGGVVNTGTVSASGTINGEVGNSGTGTLESTGTLVIAGELKNSSSSTTGVFIGDQKSLSATSITNGLGAYIVNDGGLSSTNPITNFGVLSSTGTVSGGIANTGTVSASGTINGEVGNSGTGTLESTGTLVINGELKNSSSSTTGVFIGDQKSLSATRITNGIGATIVIDGELSSTNPVSNVGNIKGTGTINGDVGNSGDGTIESTGTLVINGELKNSSSSVTGVFIGAQKSLSATRITNGIGATIVIDGELSSTNPISNVGKLKGTGIINGEVGNSGDGTIESTGTLVINGELKNSSSSTTGVFIGAQKSLSATRITNETGATIVNDGQLTSANPISNAGQLTSTGTVTGSIANTGTLTTSGAVFGSIDNSNFVQASGTINGQVANTGTGVIATTGALIINGKLTNSSINPSGVVIYGSQSLTVTEIENQKDSTIVNAGLLDVTNASSSAGTITNYGTIKATLDGQGLGRLNMDGGSFTGAATNFQSVIQTAGTITAGSTIGTIAYGQTGGTNAGADINALVRVTALGGTITRLLKNEIEASNGSGTTIGDILVVADAAASLGNGAVPVAVKTSATGTTTITINGDITGVEGIKATGIGAASSINISTAGAITTSSTAISMLADPTGGPAVANIGGNITVTTNNGSPSPAALVSTGAATFNVSALSQIVAANVLDADSGSAALNNSGTVRGAFASGPGNVSINNLSTGTLVLGDSVFGGSQDSLTNSGSVIADGALTLDGLEQFTNSAGGSLQMLDADGDDTLVVNGNLTLDPGSVINMNVNLALPPADPNDPNAADSNDLIVVGGVLTINGGTFNLKNIDTSKSILGDDLVLIRAGSIVTPSSAAPLLVSGLDSEGLFAYRAVVSGNNLLLRSELDGQAAGGVVSNFITAQNAVSNAFFKPASGFVSSPLDPEPNQLGFSVWSRASGGLTSQGSTGVAILPSGQPQTVESSVNVGFGGYQFGLDGGIFNILDSGANLHVGLTAGQVFGAASQKDVNNKTAMQDTFVGAYGIFSNGPFFVDAQLRQEFIEYTVNVDDRGFRVQDAKDSSQRFSAGVSGGYALTFGKFSVVPAVGYTFARTSTDDFNFSAGQSGATVVFDDSVSHLAFAGVSVATSFLFFDDQLRISPFVSATAYHDFGKDQTATLVANPGTGTVEIDVTSSSEKTYGELSLGANFLTLTPEIAGTQRLLSGNVRGDVQFGADRLGGSLNAQVRLQF